MIEKKNWEKPRQNKDLKKTSMTEMTELDYIGLKLVIA